MSLFHALHFNNLNKFAVKLSIPKALSVCFSDFRRVLFLCFVSHVKHRNGGNVKMKRTRKETHKGSNKTHFTSSRDPNKAQISFVFTTSLWLFTVNHHRTPALVSPTTNKKSQATKPKTGDMASASKKQAGAWKVSNELFQRLLKLSPTFFFERNKCVALF